MKSVFFTNKPILHFYINTLHNLHKKNRYKSHFKHLLINLYKHKPLLFQLNIFQDPQFFITLE